MTVGGGVALHLRSDAGAGVCGSDTGVCGSDTGVCGSDTGVCGSDTDRCVPQGREEARFAGSLLKEAGVRRLEKVYASYLKRSIKTAWLMLDELEMQWVPIEYAPILLP